MKVKPEITLKGIPASPGIAIGPVYIHHELSYEPELQIIADQNIEHEIKVFRKAINASRNYLKKTYRESDKKYGQDFTDILQVQISILEDEIFLNEVEQLISEKNFNAAYATFKVFRSKKEHFLRLSDEYLRERALDIQNLKRLILRKMLGKKTAFNFKKPCLVVADNVSPADIIKLHHKKTLGFCTNVGGKNSHAAIVARSLGVPAVVGTEFITNMVKQGDELILDGSDGIIIINPTQERIESYSEKRQDFTIHESDLLQTAVEPALTLDGKEIQVMGNIEFAEELEQLKKSGAEGIGLYRTEGLFLSGATLPSENYQTEQYIKFAEAVKPAEVIIRTLDVGGDKLLPELVGLAENNPFLGWRAIRFCLDHKEIFIPQLKAILRANLHNNMKLLLPMISSIEEIHQVKQILLEVKEILSSEGKEFNPDIELGMMVEIPSAAIMIEDFQSEVDFFSIGTNDLVQYTMAVDRANEKISHLYNHFHPALIALIKKVIEVGKENQKLVSLCGEMAGDPVAIPLLIGMGLDNLSVAHYAIPEIKDVIRHITLEDCKKLYSDVINCKTASKSQYLCELFYSEIFTVPHDLTNNNRDVYKKI
jgi:phosphotransferase system enzyme I (PtsI)